MEIEPGEPADISDVWMRVLTDKSYWKKDGTLHNKAFSGKAIAPPHVQKGWSLELSGRLLSLVKDVEKESSDFCTSPRVFAGLIYQTVENLRSSGEDLVKNIGCRTDVIFTPTEDTAHADLVSYGPTAEHRYVIRDWLQDFIQCIKPDRCSAIEALRCRELS